MMAAFAFAAPKIDTALSNFVATQQTKLIFPLLSLLQNLVEWK